MAERIPMILDLDAGIDDALALAYVLGSPEVELVGVAASFGNVTVHTAARNARALLDMLGHPEVPVWLGADRALAALAPYEVSPVGALIHGENGLGNAELPAGAGVGAAGPGAVSDSAWPAFSLAEQLERHPGLRYVPTGPLTNLAQALVASPGLAEALPRVTFMGGALTVPGNVTPFAEANILGDPEAAAAVLESGPLTRMVGLDVTHRVILTRKETAAWRELGTPAGRFLADMADYYIAVYEQRNPHLGGCALHDPLAAAVAADPSLVGCLATNLRVDLEGPTRGQTRTGFSRGSRTCAFARTVDAPRFLEEFRTRVRRALLAVR